MENQREIYCQLGLTTAEYKYDKIDIKIGHLTRSIYDVYYRLNAANELSFNDFFNAIKYVHATDHKLLVFAVLPDDSGVTITVPTATPATYEYSFKDDYF